MVRAAQTDVQREGLYGRDFGDQEKAASAAGAFAERTGGNSQVNIYF